MRKICDRVVAWVLVASLLAGASAALAQSYEEALTKFAADSFSDTEAAITAVAASGNPRAVTVIEALQDARLLFDPQSRRISLVAGTGKKGLGELNRPPREVALFQPHGVYIHADGTLYLCDSGNNRVLKLVRDK